VHAVRQAVEIPIVGMGGVQGGQDAYDLIQVGADLVAVGTESFRDPAAGSRIAAELARVRHEKGKPGPHAGTFEQNPSFRRVRC
jgi:dihydroorotate dehydrogenase (NAD+) catalytic subunit